MPKTLHNIVIVFISVVILSATYYIQIYSCNIRRHNLEDIASLEKKLQTADDKLTYYSSLLKRFNVFHNAYEGRTIDQLRHVINSNAKAYRIKHIKAKITAAPSDEDDIAKISYNKIEIIVEADNDRDIFIFINQLIKDAPGYLHITELNIEQSSNIFKGYLKAMLHFFQ